LLSALPYLVLWILNLSLGRLSDAVVRRGWASRRTARKTSSTLGMAGPAVCLLLIGFAGCQRRTTLALLMLSVTLQGSDPLNENILVKVTVHPLSESGESMNYNLAVSKLFGPNCLIMRKSSFRLQFSSGLKKASALLELPV